MAFVSLMALLAGCSSARDILPLSIETTSLSLPEHEIFGSTEVAARGIAAILTKGFGLPLPKRVNVFVYPGRLAFERGLVLEAGLGHARAAELSAFAIGVGGRGQLLLNQGGLDRNDREWLRLIRWPGAGTEPSPAFSSMRNSSGRGSTFRHTAQRKGSRGGVSARGPW